VHGPFPGLVPENVQIRNVDDVTYAALRRRAGAENMPLAGYLRRELERLATTRTMAELPDVPLLTCDARLGRAHGHDAEVIVYPRS
jgi:hypothetical protein